MKDLRERLLPFYPEMPVSELAFLLGDARSVSVDDIRKLLADNTLTNFDPVGEAFDVFDITGEGAVDLEFMSAVFRQLGFDRLSVEDVGVILKTADIDGDGVISKDDFRTMLARASKAPPLKRTPSPVPASPTPSGSGGDTPVPGPPPSAGSGKPGRPGTARPASGMASARPGTTASTHSLGTATGAGAAAAATPGKR